MDNSKLLDSIKSGTKLGGLFNVECFDRQGRRKWIEETHNIFTNEGLNHVLNAVLASYTPATKWYCGLAESNTTATATQTYAVPIFTECTGYDEATRPAFSNATSTAQSISNATAKGTFTMNATKVLYGAALFGLGTGATIKADTAGGGVLLCYAKFASSRSVIPADICNLTYTCTATTA